MTTSKSKSNVTQKHAEGYLHRAQATLTYLFQWPISTNQDYVVENPRFDPAYADEAIIIYCIHGLLDRPHTFDELIANVLNDLPPNVKCIRAIAFARRWLGVGIEDYAQQLRRKIERYKDQRILLIGHSRGGLVITEFLASWAHNLNIIGAIPLVTPFQGAFAANFVPPFFSVSISQMRPGSAYLKRLNEKLEDISYPYYPVTATYDLVVARHAASPDTKRNFDETEFTTPGHISILRSKAVADHLIEIVTQLCSPAETTSKTPNTTVRLKS